jgi:hypothetical protein
MDKSARPSLHSPETEKLLDELARRVTGLLGKDVNLPEIQEDILPIIRCLHGKPLAEGCVTFEIREPRDRDGIGVAADVLTLIAQAGDDSRTGWIQGYTVWQVRPLGESRFELTTTNRAIDGALHPFSGTRDEIRKQVADRMVFKRA